jgi:hypothetical protein
MWEGRPFRLQVQIFPDGRCGFALAGEPIWLSAPLYFARSARVLLQGRSVETHVNVARVQVGTGVAPHVAWGSLEYVSTR